MNKKSDALLDLLLRIYFPDVMFTIDSKDSALAKEIKGGYPRRVLAVSDGLKRMGEFEAAEMLAGYAALLRERESANNNDTCTDADCPRCNTPAQHRGDMSHAGIGCYPGRFCGEVVSRRIENGVDVFTIKPSFGDEFDVIKVSESAKAG